MNTQMRQFLQQVMNDPVNIGKQKGFNIPEGMSDPKAIVDHLIQSGQIPRPMLQMIEPMMRMMGK